MLKIEQIIRGGKKHVIMPLSVYNKLISELDQKELNEAKNIMSRVDAGFESLIPAEIVNDIIDNNTHPVKAWRKYRKMTAENLAKKAGISRAYVTQIETRKRNGTIKVLSKLALALDTGIDALTDE